MFGWDIEQKMLTLAQSRFLPISSFLFRAQSIYSFIHLFIHSLIHSFLQQFLSPQDVRHSSSCEGHLVGRKGIQAGGTALQEHRNVRQVPVEVPKSHLPFPYHPHSYVTRFYQGCSLAVTALHPLLCIPTATALDYHMSATFFTGHPSFRPAPSPVCALCTNQSEVLKYQAAPS